jgi:hypothetical protein
MAFVTANFDTDVSAITNKLSTVASTSGGVSITDTGSNGYWYINTVTAGTQTQTAKGTITSTLAAHEWAVGVRQTTAATKGGYYGGHQHSEYGSFLYRIWKWTEANVLTDLAVHGSQVATLSDVVELRVTGTADLELFVNGTSILTVTDGSAQLTGTRVGGALFHSATAVKLFDNFEGGDFTTYTLEQEGYRWRNDDGSESAATWKASQDTTASVTVSDNVRLRMLINRTG